ncbi:MAG: hypothetical protein R2867_25505 [Caldilineaceae bacterium]
MNVPAALDCIEANRDTILGIKLRLSRNLAADGRNEPQALDLRWKPPKRPGSQSWFISPIERAN